MLLIMDAFFICGDCFKRKFLQLVDGCFHLYPGNANNRTQCSRSTFFLNNISFSKIKEAAPIIETTSLALSRRLIITSFLMLIQQVAARFCSVLLK